MKIYHPKATKEELMTNGLGELMAISAKVREEINGEFSLDISVPAEDPNFDNFVNGAIIKAPTPKGYQYFRVAEPDKTMEFGGQAFCWHISYDLGHDVIMDRGWVGNTGAQALPDILNAGIQERRFVGSSDIDFVTNMRIVRSSVLQALIGEQDNSFLNRWGGEIERNNFTFNIKQRIGADNGVEIRYKKNLSGLKVEVRDTMVTRIIPTGLTEEDVPVLLPEQYIDSSRINDYPIPRTRAIHFSDVKVGAKDKDENILYHNVQEVREELRRRVNELYNTGADLPQASAFVEFVDLSQTEEYKDFKALEQVNIGDTVTCIYDPYKMNFQQRVVSYEYDALARRYDSIVLGDKPLTLGDSLWAQNIDLSVLNGRMDGAVMQGTRYNDVWINHEDGVITEAMIEGVKIQVRQNGYDGFALYANGNYLGGVKVIGGQAALISNILTNNVDGNCWASIGEYTEGANTFTGIFLYNKLVSETNPTARITTSQYGGLRIRTAVGAELSLGVLGPSFDFSLYGSDGKLKFSADSISAMVRFGADSSIGVNDNGPFYVKNGNLTYF